MSLRSIFPILVLAVSACASAPSKEQADYFRRTTSCGKPRIDPSLRYGLLPVDVAIAFAPLVETTGAARLRADPTMSAEGATQVTNSVHTILQDTWRLSVTRTQSEFDKSLRDELVPLWWFGTDSRAPCGKRLARDAPGESAAPVDVLLFVRARDEETSTGHIALGALTAVVLMPFAAASLASPPRYGEVARDKLERSYLLIGMADARSGELLWIKTVLLRQTDTLRNVDDVSRLVRDTFLDNQ